MPGAKGETVLWTCLTIEQCKAGIADTLQEPRRFEEGDLVIAEVKDGESVRRKNLIVCDPKHEDKNEIGWHYALKDENGDLAKNAEGNERFKEDALTRDWDAEEKRREKERQTEGGS